MNTRTDTAGRPDDGELVAELLRGAIDLHCHSGPSVMPRRLDHLEALQEASAAGMRAVLFKDHYYTATPVALLLNKHFAHLGVVALSGVPLNNASGGINRFAVDHALKLGARMVWMPTFSAANHLDHHRKGKTQGFPSPREQMTAPVPLTAFDDAGQLLDEVKMVLDLVAEHDAVLSGGHLNIREIWPVFEEGKRRGVKRFLLNHPTFILDGTLDDVRAMAAFGAYVEHSVGMFLPDCPVRCFPPADLKALIDAAGVERTLLGSDLGQAGNPSPVEGMRGIIRLCLDLGYTPDEVRAMVAVNPARLIGLDDA
jgi:hypothetical protein